MIYYFFCNIISFNYCDLKKIDDEFINFEIEVIVSYLYKLLCN